MKLLKFLGGIVFFTFMFSGYSEQNQVNVLCSTDWFMVTVHPFLLNNDVYVHFYEVHLGLGCPPNHVLPQFYQFTYRVTECGIRIKAISPDVVIYSSEIHYASKGSSSRYVIPVSCAAPRRSPWLTKPHSVQSPSNNMASAPRNDTSYQVFSLPEPSQGSNCSCPPYVFKQESM
ncbi:placenta-specific protein 1 [Cricetulus griseus]|uniref:Placenta-specific protein 1 n=1 Tax=Cricetulus griseus TaxID=10029 RepID=A0A3L7H3P1_CRIGR|nr:placenta-specific protein 1 [Cricetulus griseus]XP_027287905.1 placenta-specific protein 1 [Cricetulus griseus]XP_027287906.1 placenta-specific protein 1 [Cricetulus griseus]XP_027287907.1 placenta-specific protein 1 [Cricetulus griseus]ERE63371.1 placenta-specific protein 1 [Cricetulus griseus]